MHASVKTLFSNPKYLHVDNSAIKLMTQANILLAAMKDQYIVLLTLAIGSC